MQKLFESHVEYDGDIVVSCSENDYDSIWIDVTDCDNSRTTTIRLSRDEAGVLGNTLAEWFDVASRKRR